MAVMVRTRRLHGRGLLRQRSQYAGAHAQLDAADGGLLGLPAGKDALGVMRLDPALEEARRDREPHRGFVEALKVHPREPA